jgi:flagellin-specific chaperone FliS
MYEHVLSRAIEASKKRKIENALRRLKVCDSIVEELISFLNEEGRNPNILHKIDALESDADDEDDDDPFSSPIHSS